jgi:hypothetical protein
MAKLPTEPATAAPAVTGTEVVAVLLEVWEAAAVVPVARVVAPVVAAVLPVAVVEAAVVALVVAAVVPAAVVAPVAVVAAAEEEAAEEVEPLLEPAAATAAQNLGAAGRTWLAATSAPQALRTQEVAAPWMALWLSVVHWQA